MMNKKSKNKKLRRKLSFVLFVAVTAWWGTLYPKFCFSQFPEENKGQKDDIKISFWLAQALDW